MDIVRSESESECGNRGAGKCEIEKTRNEGKRNGYEHIQIHQFDFDLELIFDPLDGSKNKNGKSQLSFLDSTLEGELFCAG